MGERIEGVRRVSATGEETLTLRPVRSAEPRPGSRRPRPATADVLRRISDGELEVHDKRPPLTKSKLGELMTKCQGKVKAKEPDFATGKDGDWSDETEALLVDWLKATPRVGAGVKRRRVEPETDSEGEEAEAARLREENALLRQQLAQRDAEVATLRADLEQAVAHLFAANEELGANRG